jgi:hypothetical protein
MQQHRNEREKKAAAAVDGAPPGVNERTSLLLPSPTSTDFPVGKTTSDNNDDDDGGGAVPLLKKKNDHGAAEIQLVRSFGSLEGLGKGIVKGKNGGGNDNGVLVEDIEDGKGGLCGKRGIGASSSLAGSKVRCVALVTIVASCFVVGRVLLAHRSPAGGGGAFEPPWNRKPSVPRIHEDDRHGGNVSSWAFNRQPLSLLDPVDDLMLLGFKRPKDSRPKPVLTRASKEEDLEEEEEATPGPFPTGAWYQNLLLVDGEPSGIHRTYSIPYIVDVVGPIPGLRLHGNRVGASSEVVQVYNVDEYGLTVGAAKDVTVRAKSKDADPTHQYRVKKTTNLGLTLEWVRRIVPRALCFFVGVSAYTLEPLLTHSFSLFQRIYLRSTSP